MKNSIVVCPGSFDPVTKGHIDIITRATQMFEKVIVLVAYNDEKHPTFSVDERVDMIVRSTAHLKNVVVEKDNGLLADYIKKVGASAIVKGLRAMSDFEYEFQMALTNQKLCPEAETIFLIGQAENMYLSSSMVKSVGKMNGDISDFVPKEVYNDIKSRLSGKDI